MTYRLSLVKRKVGKVSISELPIYLYVSVLSSDFNQSLRAFCFASIPQVVIDTDKSGPTLSYEFGLFSFIKPFRMEHSRLSKT